MIFKERDVERCCSLQRAMRRMICDFANLTNRERLKGMGSARRGKIMVKINDVVDLKEKLSMYFSEAPE